MSPIHIAVLALAVAGILLTMYLTYIASFEAHPAFCDEGSEIGRASCRERVWLKV
jgi:hypothetical protein